MKKFLVLFWIILLSLTCSTVYAQVEGGSPAGFSEQQMQGITNYQVPVDQIREYQLQQMQLRRQGRAGFSSQAPYGGAGFVPGGRTPLGDVGAGSVYGPGIRPGFDPGMVSGIGPGARSGYGQGLGRANAYAPGYGSGYGPGRNTGSFGPRFAQRSAMPPQGNFGMYPGFAPNNFGPESMISGFQSAMFGNVNRGFMPEQVRKFLDETKDLRRQILNKKFDYFELTRNTATKPEEIARLEQEITELRKKIFEKASK